MGETSRSTIRVCAVLETGPGLNLVHREQLPAEGRSIKIGQTPIINDANGRPVNIVGTVALYVLLGAYVLKCDSYVCEQLATPYVIGGLF